jgi:DNA-binding response OmpR family regulator
VLILVVDDDEDVRSVLRRALASEGHRVETADSVRAARARLALEPSDLVVLDVGLTDGSGIALCRELRADGFAFPILILTARSEIALRVRGLEAGADDYLSKPFALAELRARVRALARRAAPPSKGSRDVHHARGDLVLDFGKRRAKLARTEVPLTAREWAILDALASRAGRVVPRSVLLEGVWGDVSDANAASLDVLVGRIRRKLGADLIRTMRGEGYALD